MENPLSEIVINSWLKRYGCNLVPTNDQVSTFQRSVIHRSTRGKANNERLEFLGDAVLGLIVAAYLHERFPDQREGFMTKMRTKLVNGVSLASYARGLGMMDYVMMSKERDETGGRHATAVLEDAFEAWLGAMFICFGFDATQSWLVKFLEAHVDFCDTIVEERDYKDRLVKHFLASYKCLPKFVPIDTKNSGIGYRMSVLDSQGRVIGTGGGPTVKVAEAMAAKCALRYYGFF
jgi:ribonuclease-3